MLCTTLRLFQPHAQGYPQGLWRVTRPWWATMPAFVCRPPGGKRLTVNDSSSSRPALPDHLSIDPRSPHHVAAVFEHDVGIRFNGKERFDVEEYCVSEGWVKVPAGKTLDRKGRPLLLTLKGTVEAFYK